MVLGGGVNGIGGEWAGAKIDGATGHAVPGVLRCRSLADGVYKPSNSRHSDYSCSACCIVTFSCLLSCCLS
jgi:hypothetical protein